LLLNKEDQSLIFLVLIFHRLTLTETGRHLTAQVMHYSGKVVVEATTKDWAIRKQLYKNTDRAAYENLARILVQRCLECGLIEMESGLSPTDPDSKV
jgi:large subunit ribosomal protein L18